MGRFGGHAPLTHLKVPSVTVGESSIQVSSLRAYSPTAHAYNINSLSTCTDTTTFLSADDLRVNLWSLDNPSVSYCIVDLKPPNSEDLTELINSAKFHTRHCNIFAYSTSKGNLRLGDTRVGAVCDRHTKAFSVGGSLSNGEEGSRTFPEEIVSSISGFEFSGDGRYIVSRDFFSLKIWDMAMESRPFRVIPLQEKLKPYIMSLYDNECIFEKFQVRERVFPRLNHNHTCPNLITCTHVTFIALFHVGVLLLGWKARCDGWVWDSI